VRRAVLVGKTISFYEGTSSQLGETLSKLSSAVFLVAADGRVVFANHAAQDLLSAGVFVNRRNDLIGASDARADAALRSAVAMAARGDGALGIGGLAIELSNAPDDDRWLAHVLPLTGGARQSAGALHAAAAAVFVRNVSLDLQWPLETIGKLYGLTPGEVRVLQAIVDVGGTPAIAEKFGISEGTVRTHLKSIFAKTGARRQADLIKMVAMHAPPFNA
jgi:DNA-binding CsgD family transcriptional regulator